MPRLATDTEVLVEDAVDTRLDNPWRVILFDDDIHTFEEVIVQLVLATNCSAQEAEQHAWRVHTEGKSRVYEGSFEECFRVQGILREIQLVTEIQG
ncbi:ATP-dependent Clp protease adaptor ClpS [Rubricoccus marinus]|uniref:Clp protease ClpS n=1 Tax=Rubricoccus marinus TaxID=716817 RepID=A0A259TYH8_9BACT|nr:ATP-dependent Clp protease adaptor ClpS [Rubricoccus marinus]OZC02746.1 Clp protease ClpS [Rubricoccus marinus]